MSKYFFLLLLAKSALSIAEENVGVIITNYRYDEWGRPMGTYSYPVNSQYPNPYYNPYYYPTSLPGSDPERFEDIFEQNRK